jgi:hypothetical protein
MVSFHLHAACHRWLAQIATSCPPWPHAAKELHRGVLLRPCVGFLPWRYLRPLLWAPHQWVTPSQPPPLGSSVAVHRRSPRDDFPSVYSSFPPSTGRQLPHQGACPSFAGYQWLRPADLGLQRPPNRLGLLGLACLATVASGHSETRINSDICHLFNDWYNRISNSNLKLVQIHMNSVQTWKLDQIASNLWIQVTLVR